MLVALYLHAFVRFLRDHDRRKIQEKRTRTDPCNKHTKLKLITFLPENLARPRGDHRKPCDTVPNVGDANEPDVGILLNSGCELNFVQCSCPNLVTFRRVVVPFSCCCVVMWKIPLRGSWGTLSVYSRSLSGYVGILLLISFQ